MWNDVFIFFFYDFFRAALCFLRVTAYTRHSNAIWFYGPLVALSGEKKNNLDRVGVMTCMSVNLILP